MSTGLMNDVKELRKLTTGFWASRVVLTANNFRIFEHLKSSRSARALSRGIRTDLRATEILLDALTALGLLNKRAGTYRNARLANLFLVKDRPSFQGDMLDHADTLWKNWSALDESLRTGRPARKARNHKAFIKAMHNNAALRANDVIRSMDLRGVRYALDLGGGPGTYSRELAKKGIEVTLVDLPETIRSAREIARKERIKTIRFRAGDLLTDPIGKGYDLVFISHVLHIFSEKENRAILRKSGDALNPGGRIVIQEFSLDKNRVAPVQGALFSVNMLINTESGRSYAAQEMKQWLRKTGFTGMKEKRMNETVLISARKKR